MAGSLASEVYNRYLKLVADIGRATASALYPNEFEYYLITLELVRQLADGREQILQFFSFPVTPNNITHGETNIATIRKNFNGITVLNNANFVPIDITIAGNFGRSFKALLGKGVVDFNSYAKPLNNATMSALDGYDSDSLRKQNIEFSPWVKTGYGSTQILRQIFKQAQQQDNGRARRLYFHNPIIGQSYLVKAMALNVTQSLQNNAIWNYTMAMKAISPIDNFKRSDSNSMKNVLKTGVLQKDINSEAKFWGAVLRPRG